MAYNFFKINPQNNFLNPVNSTIVNWILTKQTKSKKLFKKIVSEEKSKLFMDNFTCKAQFKDPKANFWKKKFQKTKADMKKEGYKFIILEQRPRIVKKLCVPWLLLLLYLLYTYSYIEHIYLYLYKIYI